MGQKEVAYIHPKRIAGCVRRFQKIGEHDKEPFALIVECSFRQGLLIAPAVDRGAVVAIETLSGGLRGLFLTPIGTDLLEFLNQSRPFFKSPFCEHAGILPSHITKIKRTDDKENIRRVVSDCLRIFENEYRERNPILDRRVAQNRNKPRYMEQEM